MACGVELCSTVPGQPPVGAGMMSFHDPAWWRETGSESVGPWPCRPFTEIVISTYGFLTDFVAWQIVILPWPKLLLWPSALLPCVELGCCAWLLPCASPDLPCEEFDLPCEAFDLPGDAGFAGADWLWPCAELPAGPCGAFACGWAAGWFGLPAGPGAPLGDFPVSA